LKEEDWDEAKERAREAWRKWKFNVTRYPGWNLRDFYHFVRERPGGLADVVVFPGPLAIINKLLGRKPWYGYYIESSVPVHIALSIIRNRRWSGDPIVKPARGFLEGLFDLTTYIMQTAFAPFMEPYFLSKKEEWDGWRWLLLGLGITLYKTRSPLWRIISLMRRAEEERYLAWRDYKIHRTKETLEEYKRVRQKCLEFRRKLNEALRKERINSPKLIPMIERAYGEIFGVGKPEIEMRLYWDKQMFENTLRGERE